MRIVQSESLVDKVVACFLDDMRQGVYAAGSKLPSHDQLQKTFGVSRNTLREALNRLESLGILRIRHGDGTYMNEIGTASSLNPLVSLLKLRGTALSELIEVRIFVEEKTVALAAERATDTEKRNLESLLGEMRGAIADPRRFAPLDMRFHREIAVAAHNALLLEFIGIIRGLMTAQQEEVARLPHVSSSSLRFHEEIVRHILAGNGAAAAATMRSHIERAYERLRPKMSAHSGAAQ